VQINVQRKTRQNLKPAETILLLLLPNANSGILKTSDAFPLHPSFRRGNKSFRAQNASIHEMLAFARDCLHCIKTFPVETVSQDEGENIIDSGAFYTAGFSLSVGPHG